ncbi:hypothetical protein BKA65DRAFT_490988 [Rhexocercosporidium sp. MPI-PUGE-AT-0058]|nr:hypothetical protein BKA65DRAFT_490988 [Rhexocercosporidium sp. MPI-PUGE-AT-0058]
MAPQSSQSLCIIFFRSNKVPSSLHNIPQMRLTVYRMWRDGNDDNDFHSRSPRNARRPALESLANVINAYDNFGGVRHGFGSGCNLDRSFSRPSQSYHLSPITTMGFASPTLASYSNRAAQTQMSDIPASYVNVGRGASMEDTEMTTPNPFQRPNQRNNQTPTTSASVQPHICSYNRDERMSASPSPIQVATAAYNKTRPYARLPVNDILNHSPPSGSQAQNGEASTPTSPRIRTSNDADHPMMTPPTSSPARSKNSISSISSDSTLRPPLNATEEGCCLLNTLYHICMDATSAYIANLLPATRHRHNQLPRHRNHGSRYQPYPSVRSGRPAGVAANANTRRRTLMDNIRDISTHMWRRARSDEMAPHRAEADAVHAMRDLYAWSEVVARGIDSDIECGEGAGKDPDEISLKVAYAAKRLCQWLGDGQAWDDCHGILRELRDLMEGGGFGGRISEVDDESLNGNIT